MGADLVVDLGADACSSVGELVGILVEVAGELVGLSVGMVGGSIGLEVGAAAAACLDVREPVGVSVDLLEGLGRLESI